MKRILSILTWMISAAGILVLYGFVRDSYQTTVIKDLQIRIDRDQSHGFLEYHAIRSAINKATDSVTGKQLRQFDIAKLGSMLNQNPWISGNETCIGLDGVVRVKVKERTAMVRVYYQNNKSVYMDEEGYIFPESMHFTPRVRIASGYISLPPSDQRRKGHVHDSLYNKSKLREILIIEKAIRENQFLDALVDQIYVSSLGEYELVPKLGKAVVVLGGLSQLDHKLNNMAQYYKSSASKPEMLEYRTISLKFRNQIVCTKI